MKRSSKHFSLITILSAAIFLMVAGCAVDNPIDYSIAESTAVTPADEASTDSSGTETGDSSDSGSAGDSGDGSSSSGGDTSGSSGDSGDGASSGDTSGSGSGDGSGSVLGSSGGDGSGSGNSNDSSSGFNSGILSDTNRLAAGTDISCAVTNDGRVQCWGSPSRDGNPYTYGKNVAAITAASGVFSKSGHICIITEEKSVLCWGENGTYQLGFYEYHSMHKSYLKNSPLMVSNLSNNLVDPGVKLLSTSQKYSQYNTYTGHTCALLDNGSVQCWGENSSGQLGREINMGYNPNMQMSTPGDVVGIQDATHISSGSAHNCAVLSDMSVKCWGSNSSGQLGDGTFTNSSSPVLVSGVINAVTVSAGSNFTCALLSDKTVTCWGANNFGQLGNGTLDHSSNAVQVSDLKGVKDIKSGMQHSCVLLDNSTVKCWGANYHGQLGIGQHNGGDDNKRLVPEMVISLTNVKSIAVGFQHNLALLDNGSIACWGYNYNTNQCGIANTNVINKPYVIPTISL